MINAVLTIYNLIIVIILDRCAKMNELFNFKLVKIFHLAIKKLYLLIFKIKLTKISPGLSPNFSIFPFQMVGKKFFSKSCPFFDIAR